MDEELEEARKNAIEYAIKLMSHANPKTMTITIDRDHLHFSQRFVIEGWISDAELIKDLDAKNKGE